MKELMQAGRLQVPVNSEDTLSVASKNPGDVGQRHCATGATFVGVERDDLTLAGLTHLKLRKPQCRLASVAAAVSGDLPAGGQEPLCGTSSAWSWSSQAGPGQSPA